MTMTAREYAMLDAEFNKGVKHSIKLLKEQRKLVVGQHDCWAKGYKMGLAALETTLRLSLADLSAFK